MCKSRFNDTQTEVNRCKNDLVYFAKNYVRVKEPNGTIRELSEFELSKIKLYSSHIKNQ